MSDIAGKSSPEQPPYKNDKVLFNESVTTSIQAVLSLVFSLLGFLFLISIVVFFISPLFSILAVVLGHVALHRIKYMQQSGAGLAISGLVIGYLSLAIAAAFFLFINLI